MMGNNPSMADALHALQERGVATASDLLDYGTPDQIIAACRRFDTEPGAKTPGLLAHWIRNREFDTRPAAPQISKGAQLRERFNDYAARYPEGATTEPHARLQARRWPDDTPCTGDMIVTETIYPVLAAECDVCGFEAGYPVKSLHVLGPPTFEVF